MPNENGRIPRRRLLPPTALLVAFETVARCKSYTRAADELALTQSAVSKQVAALEDLINVPLFEKQRMRSASLTAAGKHFYEHVQTYLSNLSTATATTISLGNNETRTLRLGVSIAFGSRWLIPRLGSFYTAHPDITIDFVTRVGPTLHGGFDHLDANIEFAAPQKSEVSWKPLIDWPLVAVASPSLAARLQLSTISDLASITVLLHDSESVTWSRFVHNQGMGDVTIKTMRFDHYTMLFQAAVEGLGVAIAPTCLIEKELKSGSLELSIDLPIKSEYKGYLVYPDSRIGFRPLRLFEEWLASQCS